MSNRDEWNEWHRVYTILRRDQRNEVYQAAVWTAIKRRSRERSPGLVYARRLRRLLASFPSGVTLVHAALIFLLLSALPPASETPPLLLGVSFVVCLNIALWVWIWLRRRLGQDFKE